MRRENDVYLHNVKIVLYNTERRRVAETCTMPQLSQQPRQPIVLR